MKKYWAIIFLAPLIAGCGQRNEETTKTKTAAPMPIVQIAPVTVGSIAETLPVTGILKAIRSQEATVTPPVAGMLDALPIHFGQTVVKGQIIGHLSTRQIEGQIQQALATIGQNQMQVEQAQVNAIQQQEQTRTSIQQAQAVLAGAQATLIGSRASGQNARQSLSREQALFADGLVAQKDVETAQLAVQTAQAQIAAQEQTVEGQRHAVSAARAAALQDLVKQKDIQIARQQVHNAQGALATAQALKAQYTLRAPLGGQVTQLGATLGETVDTTTKLATIANLDTLQLEIAVPAEATHKIHPGLQLTFRTAGGRTFATHLVSSGPQVDATTGTIPFLAVVTNPRHEFKDDTLVKVFIVTERHSSALRVPKAAILTDPATRGATVVTVSSGGVTHIVPVTFGLTAEGFTEIIQGLAAGQQVAISGQYGLPDGTKVSIGNGR